MKLKLIRDCHGKESTTGKLFVDGAFECYTLEDVCRPKKIKGCTAIPEGTYEVVVTYSNRFKRLLPLLLHVPNYEGIRIHSGNTAKDTEGCILVGKARGVNIVTNSRAAFAPLFAKIVGAAKREKIFIEVVSA
jgi:hypothetical protein